jgi:hypothetical protein
MRVYMAAFYQTAKVRTESLSVHQRITASNHIYPWILESFHYLDQLMIDSIRLHKRTVFMDSGAFSAFTMKAKLDLNRYARFLREYKDIYHIASNVDVIGRNCEKETYDNQKKLEALVGPGIVGPVHHVRDHDDWLRRYMDEGYDYLFIGGMVPEEIPVLRLWLDYIWTKYLINPDGTSKIKVHGFGLTSDELIFRYPWFSVDSTSWVIASGFGFCFLDIPEDEAIDVGLRNMKFPDQRLEINRTTRIKRYKVNFSEHSSARYDMNSMHFWSLEKDAQQVIRRRLAELEAERTWKASKELKEDFKIEMGTELAYTPEALQKSYGLRRVLNMDYYQRATLSRTDIFAHIQETLF